MTQLLRRIDRHRKGGAPSRSRTLALSALRWFAALAVIALVVEPVIWRRLLKVELPPSWEAWSQRARNTPDIGRLAEIAAFSLQDIPVPEADDAVKMADRLLGSGDFMEGFSGAPYALPFTEKSRAADLSLRRLGSATNRRPVVYALPFSEADLRRDDGIGALPYASLYLADVMLSAHKVAGDTKYLEAARDIVLAFSRFERSRWMAVGSLWNDHALATRAGVLSRFWAAYRGHLIYKHEEAVELLQQVVRTTTLLASDRDFNVRTNHGVMQNVGLLQLLLAFQGLDSRNAQWRSAVTRLKAQVDFLYADDGFVLEHSAHYHDVGVRLLGMAIRMLELAGESVPAQWRTRYAEAQARLHDITRPDRTLPAYGDTELEFWPKGLVRPTLNVRPTQFDVFPLSGYAVWRFGGEWTSHTVMNWSNFSGHGHKLADELGLSVWALGRGWLTSTGYWDYGDWGRPHTEGWQGSNAPHWLGEGERALREVRVVASAHSASAAFVSLERKNVDGTSLTREVVNLAKGQWLVVDQAHGPEQRQVETLWTVFPDLTLEKVNLETYRLRDESDLRLSVSLRSKRPIRVEVHQGSRSPFAGWVTIARQGVPAPALRVLTSSGEPVATLFGLDAGDTEGFVFESLGDDAWHASGAGWQVRREGEQLQVQLAGQSERLKLSPAPDTSARRQALQTSYAKALRDHPRELDLDAYRVRVLLLLLGAVVLQETAFALLPRRWRLTGHTALRTSFDLAPVVIWVAVGLWLHLRYFQVH